jgi:hypothetical protein
MSDSLRVSLSRPLSFVHRGLDREELEVLEGGVRDRVLVNPPALPDVGFLDP